MAGNYTTNDALTLLDGLNIRDYGFIEKATGFLDEPERKKTIEHSWPDDHGLEIDLTALRRNERRCHLDLIVKGTTWSGCVNAANNVKALFNKTGYRYLKIYGIDGVYLVYVNGLIGVSRLNRGVSNAQLARMSIPLIEPYPVKYQYYTDQTTLNQVSLAIVTTKPVIIDWGDASYSSLNTSGTVTHDYTSGGEYCIVVYGGVDGISGITPTNCTLITYGGPTGESELTPLSPTADSTLITVDDTTITADQTL